MPSEKQVKWSQLRVGLTVLVALVTLAVLIFVMTGTTGLFTKKIVVRSYVDNAGGLRVGAPVRLEGVDIGNVTGIRVVADPKRRLAPVEVTMKITTKYADTMRSDCQVELTTAGVLGEVFVDMDCRQAQGGPMQNGVELPTKDVPQLQDVVTPAKARWKMSTLWSSGWTAFLPTSRADKAPSARSFTTPRCSIEPTTC